MRLQEKGKPETAKEVKKDMRAKKDKELKKLLNYLQCKWDYANATSYSKQFRKYKLLEMINEVTYFLHVDDGAPNVITHDENFLLLSLIRAIIDVIDGKTSISKRVFEMRLKELEALSA